MSEFCFAFIHSQFPNSVFKHFTEVMCLLFQLDISLDLLCREWPALVPVWQQSASCVRGASGVLAAATLLFLLSDSLKT